MTTELTDCRNEVNSGNASRFIKEKWLTHDKKVGPSAFDLRETPPETYVSFFLVSGHDEVSQLDAAYQIMQTKNAFKNKPGALVVLKISKCLEEINDEDERIISFKDERIPHCGLHYHTDNDQKVLEAKNTLCFLAIECMRVLENTASNEKNLKKL